MPSPGDAGVPDAEQLAGAAEPADFGGRVVVITGAARGMGAAYVAAFTARGAHVVGLDRGWDGQPAPELLALTCDVTSTPQLAEACQATLDRFGRVDVLINNAAVRQRDLYPPHGAAAVLDTSDADWQRMFDTNLFGVLKVIRQFVRPMLEQRRGSIVNISSGGSVGRPAEQPGVWVGRNPAFRNQPYDASKAALTNMSFSLADELRPSNIAVNVVFPAGTRTTGSDEMVAGRAQLGIHVAPLLRPEHTVPLVLHLAAQDATTLTGQALDAVAWNTAHALGPPDHWRA